jgi:hypothetical protein
MSSTSLGCRAAGACTTASDHHREPIRGRRRRRAGYEDAAAGRGCPDRMKSHTSPEIEIDDGASVRVSQPPARRAGDWMRHNPPKREVRGDPPITFVMTVPPDGSTAPNTLIGHSRSSCANPFEGDRSARCEAMAVAIRERGRARTAPVPLEKHVVELEPGIVGSRPHPNGVLQHVDHPSAARLAGSSVQLSSATG